MCDGRLGRDVLRGLEPFPIRLFWGQGGRPSGQLHWLKLCYRGCHVVYRIDVERVFEVARLQELQEKVHELFCRGLWMPWQVTIYLGTLYWTGTFDMIKQRVLVVP